MPVRPPEWALPSNERDGSRPSLSLSRSLSLAFNGAAGETEEEAALTCSVKRRIMTPMAARERRKRRKRKKREREERETPIALSRQREKWRSCALSFFSRLFPFISKKKKKAESLPYIEAPFSPSRNLPLSPSGKESSVKAQKKGKKLQK